MVPVVFLQTLAVHANVHRVNLYFGYFQTTVVLNSPSSRVSIFSATHPKNKHTEVFRLLDTKCDRIRASAHFLAGILN